MINLALLLLAASIHLPASAAEADTSALVTKVRLAYVFNMARFVDWEDQPEVTVLCLDAGNRTADLARSLDGRQLSSTRVLKIAMVPSGLPCHIYYSDKLSASGVADADGERITPATLTISGSNDALSRGFMVRVFEQNGKMGFSVNDAMLRGKPFQMSSKLLRLARAKGS